MTRHKNVITEYFCPKEGDVVVVDIPIINGMCDGCKKRMDLVMQG
jgi:hypothetical protein